MKRSSQWSRKEPGDSDVIQGKKTFQEGEAVPFCQRSLDDQVRGGHSMTSGLVRIGRGHWLP